MIRDLRALPHSSHYMKTQARLHVNEEVEPSPDTESALALNLLASRTVRGKKLPMFLKATVCIVWSYTLDHTEDTMRV